MAARNSNRAIVAPQVRLMCSLRSIRSITGFRIRATRYDMNSGSIILMPVSTSIATSGQKYLKNRYSPRPARITAASLINIKRLRSSNGDKRSHP